MLQGKANHGKCHQAQAFPYLKIPNIWKNCAHKFAHFKVVSRICCNFVAALYLTTITLRSSINTFYLSSTPGFNQLLEELFSFLVQILHIREASDADRLSRPSLRPTPPFFALKHLEYMTLLLLSAMPALLFLSWIRLHQNGRTRISLKPELISLVLHA
jgi:hypothetical protein